VKIERVMFLDSVSTNQVQLRRQPGVTALPEAHPGVCLHQLTITTGVDAATNADTTVFHTCSRWRVSLEKIS
jgi:hypothetical protein